MPRLKSKPRSQFAATALLLQGGGALGSYQAGVYQALAEAEVLPDWIGGISIGAINGAIIAGNKPADRVARLRRFWEQATMWPVLNRMKFFNSFVEQGGIPLRFFWNNISAGVSIMAGAPGFYLPRPLSPWALPWGTAEATSYYDTGVLRQTLQTLVDFDYLNSGTVRYTVSAVNVRTGNYETFDNTQIEITPEHVMASGALPPGFPAVEIEGERYWDGGTVSNTPLYWVVGAAEQDTLIFQVDVWCAEGRFPINMPEVATRLKEVQYSSRTRWVTDQLKHTHKLRLAISALYDKLPEDEKASPEAQRYKALADCKRYNIVHLIYRSKDYEGYSKDFEFSRTTMEEHWRAGYNDTVRSLRHSEIFTLPEGGAEISTFDLARG